MLQPPALAPLDIKVVDESDQATTLRKFLGKWVVLYFYPRDNTPGCTVEACSFRDANSDIKKLGAVVIGVSKDNQVSHEKFKTQHQLNFPLWSDSEHQLLEAFGAWGEKKFMGRLFMGITRSTFIIDPQGKIAKTWEKVSPKNHSVEILEFLQNQIKSQI